MAHLTRILGLLIHRPLLAIAVVVLGIKLTVFALDPLPAFFMGDSASYILSAVHGWVLRERSTTYGLLIRCLAVWPGTLTTLVLAQALAGAAAAWMLALALLRFFGVRPVVTLAAAIILALDPLQIMHERLVLTEASTIFVLAGYILFALWYLNQPRLLALLAMCMTGIILVSLRAVYVPVVLGAAVVLPLLGWPSPSQPRERLRQTKQCIVHLSMALLVTFGLHAGYRGLMGIATGHPPAYHYYDGFFLAAAWAPTLKPEDADDPRAAQAVQRQLDSERYPLQKRRLRWAQIWREGGLAHHLRQAYDGDGYAANDAAKRMCLRALRRDPLIIFRQTLFTYRDYWGLLYDSFRKAHDGLRRRLLDEQGTARPPRKEFLRKLKEQFGLDAGNGHVTMTLSKRYHLVGAPWYAYLVLSPLIGLLSIWLCRPGSRRQAGFVFFTSAVLMAATCAAGVESSIRFLHPFSFTALIASGVIVDFIWRSSKR